MSSVPEPTPIFRVIHVDNLRICLRRGGLHGPNHTPDDGLVYKPIHNRDIQQARCSKVVACGPGGVLHDYVLFYFGYLSPMMLNLKTGRIPGYTEGQQPLIYLVAHGQDVYHSGAGFVFSEGHGIARITMWYDDLANLHQVDWDMVYQRYWWDTVNNMERKRSIA